jgi:hypothetical protein
MLYYYIAMSNSVKDDYVPPVFLTDEARDLNDRFYLLLNNIVATFPYSKIKPNSPTMYDRTVTNKADYDNNMALMLQLQNDYFMYKNSVVRSSENVLKEMNAIDILVNDLDKQNADLSSQLSALTTSGRSAEGMLDDSQLTRNQMFYGNIILFLVIASGGYMYYKKVYMASV